MDNFGLWCLSWVDCTTYLQILMSSNEKKHIDDSSKMVSSIYNRWWYRAVGIIIEILPEALKNAILFCKEFYSHFWICPYFFLPSHQFATFRDPNRGFFVHLLWKVRPVNESIFWEYCFHRLLIKQKQCKCNEDTFRRIVLWNYVQWIFGLIFRKKSLYVLLIRISIYFDWKG